MHSLPLFHKLYVTGVINGILTSDINVSGCMDSDAFKSWLSSGFTVIIYAKL